MGRPAGPTDYNRRMKAFEMFSSGIRKADIAKELGVSRPAIGLWAKKDKWDERLSRIVSRAEEALNHTIGNQVSQSLERLRTKMGSRLTELEILCGPSSHPTVRLQAIKLWLNLAGISRAMPNPADPTTPKSLELIQDLIETNNSDDLDLTDGGERSNDTERTSSSDDTSDMANDLS